MLRILPLADDLILPQAKQDIYFFNRIGRFLPFITEKKKINPTIHSNPPNKSCASK